MWPDFVVLVGCLDAAGGSSTAMACTSLDMLWS